MQAANLRLKPEETLVIVMDPLKGIADDDGQFAKDFGLPELREIRQALENCQNLVDSLPYGTRVIFIRSEYAPYQFAPGNVAPSVAPLSNWDNTHDSKWAEGIRPPDLAKILTKRVNNAAEEVTYRTAIITAIHEGVRFIIFGGGTTTTCIKQTSIATQAAVTEKSVQCVVPLDLVGARMSYHKRPADGSPSRIEQTIEEIRAAGVKVINSIKDIEFSTED